MPFSFASRTLDVERRELWHGARLVALEPQVFDLLVYLIRNRHRVVSKDDLIAGVWGGRIVSDSTLTSRINAARKAIGDSGATQAMIRTLARKGIRFVAEVDEEAAAPIVAPLTLSGVGSAEADLTSSAPHAGGDTLLEVRRVAVAIMPFSELSGMILPGGPADALVYDLITRLAKLRSLRVIAQGSVFALRDRRVAPEEAGRLLGVDYVVSGSVQRRGKHLVIGVELAETRGSRIVWAETFDQVADDTFQVLDEIGDCIVASVDREIETMERNRAILKPPNSLDAWEAHHRGLWHMYRFTKTDNDLARHFFEMALRIDPTYSRAHAGLSFTHWQNAFQGWAERQGETERAYGAAAQSLTADDRDPAAHWAMGRALWLRNRQDQSLDELELAVELSPNFAAGHYSLAFVHSQMGDPEAAIAASDLSRHLSPFDPMLFGMLASRALALVRLGRFAEAAEWGAKAALRPNAHAHVLMIAALSLALAARLDEARAILTAVQNKLPHYSLSDFFAAFHLASHDRLPFEEGARRIGLE